VGEGDSAGVWQREDGVPESRPEFREQYARQLAKLARQRKSEEMI
jgi:hypothetical protein